MKKERPVLFSTAMVKALLDGRKTMTRRIIKSRHESGLFRICKRVIDGVITQINSLDWDERDCEKDITCPYGKVGDILWVKETFTINAFWPTYKQVHVLYEGQSKGVIKKLSDEEWEKYYKWKKKCGRKSSLFMFRSLSRIRLEITDVMVERLQDISEEDAMNEGAERGILRDGPNTEKGEFHLEHNIHADYRNGFKFIWMTINGKESWDSNPWVWVISFKKL